MKNNTRNDVRETLSKRKLCCWKNNVQNHSSIVLHRDLRYFTIQPLGRKFLVPELQPGQTIIMDNATFHKSQKTKELIESAGCRILFLQPYSPDLNPIEIFWANFKKLIRKNLERIKNLSQAIDKSFLMCVGQRM